MNERGVILLEVLLAVTILSLIGVSSVAFISTTIEAQARLHEREVEMAQAERVLTAMALLSRADLEQRLGRREISRFVVWVDRAEPSLFRIGIAPSSQPMTELLSTLAYRSPEDR